MLFKESQDLGRKESHGEEGQNKAKGVHTDEEKAIRHCTRRPSHQKDAA